MLEAIECGSNSSSHCNGNLILIRLEPNENIEFDRYEENTLKTNSFEIKYTTKTKDYLMLLMCNKCGKLYSESSHLFLTSNSKYIHFCEGKFYVSTNNGVGKSNFAEITKMLIYSKTGTATKAKVMIKEGWSDI